MMNSAAIKGQKERKIPVMEKIASFTIDHIKLKPGIYVSRKDHVGDSIITTFDLRMTSPNDEPVMNTAEVHTIEHLGATFLRNHEQWKDKTVYFGPMGCRTGFYMSLIGTPDEQRVADAWKAAMEDVLKVQDQNQIPELNVYQCGTYQMHSLQEAQDIARSILERDVRINSNEELALPKEKLQELHI